MNSGGNLVTRYEWHVTDSRGELIPAGFTMGHGLSPADVRDGAIRRMIDAGKSEETVRAAFA